MNISVPAAFYRLTAEGLCGRKRVVRALTVIQRFAGETCGPLGGKSPKGFSFWAWRGSLSSAYGEISRRAWNTVRCQGGIPDVSCAQGEGQPGAQSESKGSGVLVQVQLSGTQRIFHRRAVRAALMTISRHAISRRARPTGDRSTRDRVATGSEERGNEQRFRFSLRSPTRRGGRADSTRVAGRYLKCGCNSHRRLNRERCGFFFPSLRFLPHLWLLPWLCANKGVWGIALFAFRSVSFFGLVSTRQLSPSTKYQHEQRIYNLPD